MERAPKSSHEDSNIIDLEAERRKRRKPEQLLRELGMDTMEEEQLHFPKTNPSV